MKIDFFLFSTRFGDLAFLWLQLFSTWLRLCVFVCICIINPWTYKQMHTPTVVQGEGGGSVDGTTSSVILATRFTFIVERS